MFSSQIPVWKRIPFLLFLFPFVSGIATGWYLILVPVFKPIPAVGVFLIAFFLIYFVFRAGGGRLNRLAGIAVFLTLFLFGVLMSWWHNKSLRTNFAGHLITDSSIIEVRLTGSLVEKEKSWKAEGKLMRVANGKEINKASGKTLLYFQKGKGKPDLQYGDVLLMTSTLQPIENSGNPGGFDYKTYCRSKNIWFRTYLPDQQWKRLKRGGGNRLYAFFRKVQKQGVAILKKYIIREREAGMAEALILGYRGDLDAGLVQAFTHVGVVHLIAISGLHVGLIYLLLLWVLRILPSRTRIIKGVVVCIALWGFALLTGAHPSTLRATLMFTFLVAGKYFFRRKPDTFNILAASAFLLICYDPFLIFDVGFQLSYLAVAGILLFQRPIECLFWSKYKGVNYCWKMMSVSLSAQIFVFPLVLFYFHQFPLFFLFTNLVLIPLASLALYGEALLLLFSFIPIVAEGLGWGVTQILFSINESVLWVDRLPLVHLEYYNLTLFKLSLLYGCIIGATVWLFQKNKKAGIYGLLSLTVFFLIETLDLWQVTHQKKVIVYQMSGYTALELVRGRRSHFFFTPANREGKNNLNYVLTPSKGWLNLRVRSMEGWPKSFFIFNDKKFVMLHKGFCPDRLRGFLPVDYVILSRFNHLEMKEIAAHFMPQAVIFDASVKTWQRKKWKTACNQLNLHWFSVPDQGAWMLTLK